MIDTLYVNGCSWTQGDELQTDPVFNTWLSATYGYHMKDVSDIFNWHVMDKDNNVVVLANVYFNKFNWAGAVANNLDIKNIINEAAGGGSNPRIVRTTCDYLRKCSQDELNKLLVIIGWSAVDRNEICVNNPTPTWEMLNVHCKISENSLAGGNKIKTNRDLELDEFHKLYVTTIKTDFASIHRYFLDQYLLAGLLTSLGVRFLFFNGLPPWWNHDIMKPNIQPKIDFARELEYQESHNNMLSINDTFYTFCHTHNLSRGAGHHPLSDAHHKWGEYLVTKLKERNIV